jgi:hypothetical protein
MSQQIARSTSGNRNCILRKAKFRSHVYPHLKNASSAQESRTLVSLQVGLFHQHALHEHLCNDNR